MTVRIALSRTPAPVLFVVGGLSMYLGAALAVALFSRLPPAVVALLRVAGAALLLVGWRRPAMTGWRAGRLLGATAFGLATAGMNIAFYEAIARLPLGTAVAVEFCGPVAVAALCSRRPRDAGAAALAAFGVGLIADVRWSGSPEGVLWALVAAGLWAAYILLGKRVASTGAGIDEIAVGFTAATLVLSPLLLLGGQDVAVALFDPVVPLLALGVGALSSAVPYVLDQVVLRRVGRGRFAVLLALLPVTATVVGLAVLGQLPGALEVVGTVAVIGAVLLRSRDGDAPAAAW